jgi:uncharacterized protein YciI
MRDGLFALIHRPGPAWAEGVGYREQPGIERHIGHMRRLFDEGSMVMGGPFLDDAGGLVLLEVHGLDDATRLARDDPTVRDGLLSVEVHPWRVVFRGDAADERVNSRAG